MNKSILAPVILIRHDLIKVRDEDEEIKKEEILLAKGNLLLLIDDEEFSKALSCDGGMLLSVELLSIIGDIDAIIPGIRINRLIDSLDGVINELAKNIIRETS